MLHHAHYGLVITHNTQPMLSDVSMVISTNRKSLNKQFIQPPNSSMTTQRSRLVVTIMETRLKTVHTSTLLFSLVCVIILQLIACSSRTWYVYSIDINKCLNCGRIIVTMGTLIEDNIETLEDEHYSKEFSMDAINRRDYQNSVYSNIDTNDYQTQGEGRRSDTMHSAVYTEQFKIEDWIHVYVGIWGTSLCTDALNYCVDLDTEVALTTFSFMRSLRHMQGESMYHFWPGSLDWIFVFCCIKD